MVDRYTKVVLTVIAVALVWIGAQQSISEAMAQRFGQPMLIAGISTMAAECLAGHLRMIGGDAGNCIAGW